MVSPLHVGVFQQRIVGQPPVAEKDRLKVCLHQKRGLPCTTDQTRAESGSLTAGEVLQAESAGWVKGKCCLPLNSPSQWQPGTARPPGHMQGVLSWPGKAGAVERSRVWLWKGLSAGAGGPGAADCPGPWRPPSVQDPCRIGPGGLGLGDWQLCRTEVGAQARLLAPP